MIVVASEQTTAMHAVSLLNLEHHRAGLCAANHDIEYAYGWLRVDGGPRTVDRISSPRPHETDRSSATGKKATATCCASTHATPTRNEGVRSTRAHFEFYLPIRIPLSPRTGTTHLQVSALS